MTDYRPSKHTNHNDNLRKVITIIKTKLEHSPISGIAETIEEQIEHGSTNVLQASTGLLASIREQQSGESTSQSTTESQVSSEMPTESSTGTSSESSDPIDPAASNPTSEEAVASVLVLNTLQKFDSDPATDNIDVNYIDGDCFTIPAEYAFSFKDEQVQPFSINGTNYKNTEEMKNLFNTNTGDDECSKFAIYQFNNKLISNSTKCPEKPLCFDDCQKLNSEMQKCGYPAQSCANIESCIKLDENSVGESVQSTGFLAWWAILLIVLALLIPLVFAIFKLCQRRKRKGVDEKMENGSQKSISSLGSMTSGTKRIARVQYEDEVPIEARNKAETYTTGGRI